MRATLEQLKAMSDQGLRDWWFTGRFPFESLSCGKCITEHAEFLAEQVYYRCEHKAMGENVKQLAVEFGMGRPTARMIRTNLEQLYALRLFYDSLYPQPAPEPEQAVATQPISAEVLGER